MGQQGFNFQALVRALGLKNVSELPVVEALTPVISAGDGSDLVGPLLPPQAWGGSETPAVLLEHAAIQVQVLSGGGAYIDLWFGRGRGAGEIDFRMRIATGNILAADPLIPGGTLVQNTGPTDVVSIVHTGTTTVAASSLTQGFAASSGTAGGVNYVSRIYVPMGHWITMQCDIVNQPVSFGVFWKELPAAINPTG